MIHGTSSFTPMDRDCLYVFSITAGEAFNTLKIAGFTFIGVALAFLAFWPMLPDDLFMKLIFGFFIVLFLPIGLAIYIAGCKEEQV